MELKKLINRMDTICPLRIAKYPINGKTINSIEVCFLTTNNRVINKIKSIVYLPNTVHVDNKRGITFIRIYY